MSKHLPLLSMYVHTNAHVPSIAAILREYSDQWNNAIESHSKFAPFATNVLNTLRPGQISWNFSLIW